MSTPEPRVFRDACGAFATGVNVITTHCDGHDHGMTANAFMSISLDPPLIAISIAEKARMLGKIQKSGRFAVSVLASGMDAIAWHFAGKPNADLHDLFDTLDDLPVIRGAVATFSASVYDEIIAGDHTIFLGHVRTLIRNDNVEPVLFFKGKFGALENTSKAPASMLQLETELMW
ncbi:flavin reductase family protein [Rhizobium mayense]|uniref:Flavin reductase family protein n=1 Tax=Rhizobium mayense TaxID=1312184 RepID=A0ABT7JXE3_9HYPH|nr:flavin reductase family protein [Rhizobium mayense]MDL2401007.1 flavin reductase family protein [Rhizobium mayense]